MLPKIVVGWQSSLDDFLSYEKLSTKNLLIYEGDSGNITDLRDWLNFVTNLTRTDPSFVLLVNNLDRMSSEAQNILLKPLEEKSAGVIFYLLSKSENLVLPTILSRCLLVKLRAADQVSIFWKDFVNITKGGPGVIVDFSEKIDQERVELFIDEVIFKLKTELGKGVNEKRLKIIGHFLDANNVLKFSPNLNRRLVLEHLMFSVWRVFKT